MGLLKRYKSEEMKVKGQANRQHGGDEVGRGHLWAGKKKQRDEGGV